ncbi:MAG TPA: hypothetical protein VK851_07090 [Anaerolineales bacterium]|nr:hypothetical protein [Anaerolineales bacterium]
MKKSITRGEWSTLILFLAIIFGAFVRFNPTILAGFAINDGGMFSVMIDDLRNNGYLIPAFTSYNRFDIPYAYPPLGFYVGAITSDLFGMDALQVVRWLPAFFATLSIPAFYLLAQRLLKNKYQASLASLIFALMPRAFFWFIMGGGLTRSMGQFFMLLGLWAIVRLYAENRCADIFLAGLFSGLAILSHPEAAVHIFISASILWLMLARNRRSFMSSLLFGLIVLTVSLLWWATVIRYHGVEPLLSATQTAGNALAIFHLLFLVFAEEPYVTFITVLAVIGIFHRFVRRDYLLLLWMIVPFLLSGRSATNLVIVPFAMLAAVGLGEVLLPALQASVKGDSTPVAGISQVERNVTIYLILYLVFSAYQFGFQLSSASLLKSDLDAMRWVNENTPAESRFLVLTGTTSVACDAVSEWFPAIAERHSPYTIQGQEWSLSEKFKGFITQTVELQACVYDDITCLDEKSGLQGVDYVYLERRLSVNNCDLLDSGTEFRYFLEQMQTDDRFESVYENDGSMVFKVR